MTLYFWIFIEMMILVPAAINKDNVSIIIAAVTIFCASVLLLCQTRLKGYSETLNMLVSLLASIGNMLSSCLMLDDLNQSVVYLRAWAAACFQLTIIRQLQQTRLQAFVLIISLIIRLVVTNLSYQMEADVTLRFVFHELFIVCTCFLGQKQMRNIFQNFYEQKEKNIKFKTLLDDYLPQSVFILDNLTQKPLFSNKAFMSIFQQAIHPGGNKDVPIEKEMKDLTSTFLHSFKLQKTSLRETGLSQTFINMNDKITNLKELIEDLNSNNFHGQKSLQAASTFRHEGQLKLFEVLLIPVVWDGRNATTIILNDITYQENLIALRIADANKDKVIATVSHELRTPLNGIIGILSIAESKTQQPEMNEYLSLCKDNANLLLGLVNSLLDLQQLRQGKIKLNIAEVSIRKLIQDTIKLFQYQCNQKGIYLKEEISAEVPERIFTDEGRMKQILINLIGNAIKFTFKGGITIQLNQDPEDPDHLRVKVSDTGIGIQEEDKNKLFKMYGKLEDSKGVNKNGIGLGLTISEALAKILCHSKKFKEITLESEYGIGTSLSFSISKNLHKKAKRVTLRVAHDQIDQEEKTNFIPSSVMPGDEENEYLARCEDSKMDDFTVDSQMHRYSMPQKLSMAEISSATLKPKKNKRSGVFFNDSLNMTREWDGKPPDDSDVLTPKLPLLSNISNHWSATTSRQLSTPKKEWILIVDDNPFNIMIAKHFVEQLNYCVESALNGQEAIEKIKALSKKSQSYKAILMDCQMPVMDGFEATKVIKDMFTKGEIQFEYIIALTANSSDADKRKCLECGMSDHLAKPLLLEDLMKALAKIEKNV